MNLPPITAIILNWNGLNYTIPCVDSCLQTNYPSLRLLVVDNGSRNDDATVLIQKYASDSRVQILALKTNLGYAGGNNEAIKVALADLNTWGIVILNNDTIVDQNFFHELVIPAIQPNSPSDMINAHILKMNAPRELDNLGMEMTLGLLTFSRISNGTKLFCPSGCAVLYTRRLLETVALVPCANTSESIASTNIYLDPNYFCYAEDTDLGWRALLAGFTPAVARKALVYHAGSASAGLMSDFSVYYSYRNLIWTAIKCLPRWWWPLWIPPILAAYSALLLLYIARGRALILLKAYWHGLRAWPRLLPLRRQIQKTTTVKPRQLLKYFSWKIFSLKYLFNHKIT